MWFVNKKTLVKIEELDRALQPLFKQPWATETKASLKQLEIVELIIHKLEENLEFVSRCLVTTRFPFLMCSTTNI